MIENGPGARRFHAMVYVPRRHSLLLFGGSSGPNAKSNTLHEYHIARKQWTLLPGQQAPPPAEALLMTIQCTCIITYM
jgi:hypothetical protein